MTEKFDIVDPEEIPVEQFNTCDTSVRKLTKPLGCSELRINQVILKPGEVTTPHTHEGQEELFVAMTEGQIAIDREVHDVPEGSIVRVHPDTLRNLLNKTEDTHIWLAFGAPPVGTVDGFGTYIVDKDS